MTDFGLDNYLKLEAKQQPTWPDAEKVAAVRAELAIQPPLVFAGEVDILRARLAEAASGKAFLLQGGDCAETFVDATADRIRNRIKTILQMAVVLCVLPWLPTLWRPFTLSELWQSALLWINMPPTMVAPLNLVWWTLPIEFSFYLALPLLVADADDPTIASPLFTLDDFSEPACRN